MFRSVCEICKAGILWLGAVFGICAKRGIGLTFKEAAEVFSDPYALEVFNSTNSTLEESRISRALFLNISAQWNAYRQDQI